MEPDRRGFYRCPYVCGDPDWPQPKWKTIAGIEKHLAKCTQNPANLPPPPPPPPVEAFGDCPTCSRPVTKGESIWVGPAGWVCFGCAADEGYWDCAGMELAGFETFEA